ncbi:MAG TPA: hypothetical protein VHT52_05585, partial [Stellaceae bacterium]|nr:hypothetical protein [Stellaceae bacterium]
VTTNSGRGPLPGDRYQADQARTASQGAFCQRCGAWRGSLGLEPDYRLYVDHLVEVLRETRRVLRRDGTLWLVLGDSYATGAGKGLKPKDLVGIPWTTAGGCAATTSGTSPTRCRSRAPTAARRRTSTCFT